ncbi:hypothetical protein [Rhodobacter sp. NSM]|uniref:hypothetical protein n=1 Tax=Rhodobacter sp. NSM TaxID=3457501 RepID=UPI003FCF782A
MPAHAAAPYQYLATAGRPGDGITPLLWALLGVSILVVVLIAGFVLFGLRRVQRGVDPAADRASVHRADERHAMLDLRRPSADDRRPPRLHRMDRAGVERDGSAPAGLQP